MKKLIILSALIVLFSCNNDDDSNIENDKFSLNLVTGLDIRADQNFTPIRLGNPNILVEQTLVYPNPAPTALSIIATSSGQISDIWIIRGNPQRNYQDIDFDSLLHNSLYSEEALHTNSEANFTDLNTSNTIINLSDFEEGYYRAFIKIDDNIEWHNIYVGAPDIDAFIESWN